MVEKRCNLLHESVQEWDVHGRTLYCNNKTAALFNKPLEGITSFNDMLEGWTFFDINSNQVARYKLPPYLVLETRKPYTDKTFKMVSAEETKWILFSASPIFSDDGNFESLLTTVLDITKIKSDEQRYKNIANFDLLTKLPNRMLLADRLDQAITHADRSHTSVAVCLIDLDGFKEVNDLYGHDSGDAILIEASKRMKKAVRSDDTVARLGGDEFVIILKNLPKSEDCALTLYRILNSVSSPYSVGEQQITTISASIGVSLYPDDKVDADMLLRHADVAMYKSKNSGKNKFSFFDITHDQKIKANFKTINKIKKSLQEGEFCLYYQPKVNTVNGEILEVEALARWRHSRLGLVAPAEFLPLIENDEELCEQFDTWVIHEAVEQLLRWQQENFYIKICINISPRQFKSRQFVNWVKEVLADAGAPLELLAYLEFEILETAAVESLTRSNEIINECQAMGISFALDDFGTGYSTLMHLKELHVDTIKIDRVFVSGMLDDPANLVIVQAVIALANAFDITVTAEGAENIEHVMSLLEMGCDAIQGYAISRPLPASEIISFVRKFTPDPRWKLASQMLPSKADFELLLAMSNHKYWIELVLNELSNEAFVEESLILDHKKCRFGKWFEIAKKKRYAQALSFETLDVIHKRIHQEVEQTAKTLKREKRSIRKDELLKIEQTSDALTQTLEKVRKEVESLRQKDNLIQKILEKRNKYVKHE